MSQLKSLPRYQLRWTTLPSDIVTEIFAYLPQRDCLTCMAACRDWYDSIPHYVHDVWTTVQFGVRAIRMENKRQTRCLGDHVKTVVVDSLTEDLFHLMNKLLEWGCTKIKTLELRNCAFDDQDEFLTALSNLASQLTHMKMIDHETDVAFRHLFHSCPELTHFTFLGNKETVWDHFEEPEVKTELPTTKQLTNIKYLCIDAELNGQLRLKPILECCPNLRCFIGASWDDEPLIYGVNVCIAAALGPNIIFELCPKITHLQNTFSYNSTTNKLEYFDPSNEDGLRYFSQCEDTGHEAVVQILTNHQTTLEHLCLQKFDPTEFCFDFSSVFKSLQLPLLRVLYLGSVVVFSKDSLITLLNNCPLIEKVSWQSFEQLDRSTIESLHVLPHLRILECSSFKLSPDVSLLTLLERFPALEDFSISFAQLPLTLPTTSQQPNRLKRLYLKYIQIPYDGDDREDRLTSFFQHLTAHSPELRLIQLRFIAAKPAVGSKFLEVIANIPTLKVCEIEVDRGQSIEAEQNSVKQFVNLLKGTKIEQLKLYYLRDLSYDILDALGDLPLLTRFHNTGHNQMRLDEKGLLNMLRKSNALTDVTLRNVAMGGTKQRYDDLIDLVRKELPLYDISFLKSDQQSVDTSMNSEKIYKKLSIVKRQNRS